MRIRRCDSERSTAVTGLAVLWVPLVLLVLPAVTNGASVQAVSSLRLFDQVLITTAEQEFAGHDKAFTTAINWHRERLAREGRAAPHLICAEYGKGRQSSLELERFLGNSESFRRVSNSRAQGTCFMVTASSAQAAALSEHPTEYGLSLVGPLPSVLKIAPGLLDHEASPMPPSTSGQERSARLATTHGRKMSLDNVGGLSVALSPGTLSAARRDSAKISGRLIEALHQSLMSDAVDLHAANFWSDRGMLEGHRKGSAEGALRAREWTRAAQVVHELCGETAVKEGPTPGDICSWDSIIFHHAGGDTLMVTGMDHLLPGGRGAGGKGKEESDELQMACLMGLVSTLASTPEVLRVSPLHVPSVNNAVAASIIQAGTTDTSEKPLTAAGLDGSGEIIQIVDSGLDESSCFFIDGDGEEVEHGYYFDEIGFNGELSITNARVVFTDGYFPFDLTRRKIIQYIRLVRPETVSSSEQIGYFTTAYGGKFSSYSASGFGLDLADGHGTHTAGSAAGSTLSTPAEATSCTGTDVVGCIGGCLDESDLASMKRNAILDWDAWCPQFECDGNGADFELCLDEDVSETLTANGGMAQGAKLAIFDSSVDGLHVWGSLAGNGLWASTDGTGCLLHSNSWGGDTLCSMDDESVSYDGYMYQNPEHLLLFAAGNDGDLKNDRTRDECTVGSPGIAKNVLTIGASSSTIERVTYSGADGNIYDGNNARGTIDTVAFFSSYGPTTDNRIKPEIVAPGDQVLSAASDGSDGNSCRLTPQIGTSMSTPIAAGAAAMVRQYFTEDRFYATDVNTRGLCAPMLEVNGTDTNAFVCDAFSPSAATVKAVLINSADLMGESSEPDGFRGFGRIHLEAGLPLNGTGNNALFVVDSSNASVAERTIDEYFFTLVSGTGLEFRATLSWIDPPASADSSIQLIHDLDLTLVSPSGEFYRMWSTGADERNVNERVILSADEVEDNLGEWIVAVSSASLTEETQAYSLVVTGPIGDDSGIGTTRTYNAGVRRGGSATLLLTAAAALAAIVAVSMCSS